MFALLLYYCPIVNFEKISRVQQLNSKMSIASLLKIEEKAKKRKKKKINEFHSLVFLVENL